MAVTEVTSSSFFVTLSALSGEMVPFAFIASTTFFSSVAGAAGVFFTATVAALAAAVAALVATVAASVATVAALVATASEVEGAALAAPAAVAAVAGVAGVVAVAAGVAAVVPFNAFVRQSFKQVLKSLGASFLTTF